MLNRGVPIDVVAERVNASVRVLKKHYDKPSHLEEIELPRRSHIEKLDVDEGSDGGATDR